MGLHIFKLEKLRIQSYKDARRQVLAEWFEAMFNPTELSLTYTPKWEGRQAINAPTKEHVYSHSEPQKLSLQLTLDGTGVDEIGALALTRMPVSERLKLFRRAVFDYDGEIHEPRYLVLSWGTQEDFPCRLCQYTVTYTMFDRDGSPLRAVIAAKFDADMPDDTSAMAVSRQSPDLTHARIVRAGDTLPLLTHAMYGSSAWYVDVARYNGLDDFRALEVGRQILFPPLAALRAPSGGGAERG